MNAKTVALETISIIAQGLALVIGAAVLLASAIALIVPAGWVYGLWWIANKTNRGVLAARWPRLFKSMSRSQTEPTL